MQMAGPERARLFVEGVRAAITADVTRRRHDGMVVAQALPFLRLDTPVVESDGTRARIAGVTIAMDGDVPRLMLELVREEEPSLEAPVLREDDTLERFTPGVSTRPARTDSTVPYDFRASARETEVVVVPRGERTSERTELARVEPARSEPVSEPWWSRLARRISALFAMWTRRSLALPERAS